MRVDHIVHRPEFIEEFKALDVKLKRLTIKTVDTFRHNPLYPSLRLHQLKEKLSGLWSISVNLKVRIIFSRLDDGTIVFESIGHHDIYKHL
jgi:mRNA-degrading endonuclease YafQ of YafQ-DinJ toxin-antitoxin module